MKSKKLLGLLLTCVFVMSTALVGCSNSTSTSSNSKGTDKEQYLNVALGKEPKTLDPSKSSDLYSAQIITQVCEGLTRVEVDKDGKDVIKEAGAEKWDVSEDGTKWTFHLRDYEWSDGKKVTSKDYEYGIKRTIDPKVGGKYASMLYPIKDAEECSKGKASLDSVGVKAIDDKTLEITLKAPCAYFLKTTCYRSLMPQRKDIVEKNGDKFGADANTMVYCGPFTIKEWTHGSKIELVKNEKYWDAKSVKLGKATMKVIDDDGARMNELSNGSIDISRVSTMEWKDKLDKTEKYDVIKIPGSFTKYEALNEKSKLFTNAKVRKAFSLAINREDAVKAVFPMLTPAHGWAPPSLQIGDKDYRKEVNEEPVKKLKAENADAKKLLSEGLKELGMDEDPSKVTVQYLQGTKDPDIKKIAEYFQQMYQKNLGINMNIEYLPWPAFMKKINSGDFEMATLGWQGDYNDPMGEFDMWLTGANTVPISWSNTKYDDLIKKAGELPAAKNDERTKLFKEAESVLLYEDAAVAPIAYGHKEMYKHKYVKGAMAPMFGSELDLKHAYTEGRSQK